MAEILLPSITRGWSWKVRGEMLPFKHEKQTSINQPNIMPKFQGLPTLFIAEKQWSTYKEGWVLLLQKKKKEKYLCADAQLLMFQSSPSRIKILSILSFASTEVGKRKACILFCRFKQELIVFVLMAMEIREVIKFINLISVPQKYSPKGWINTELTAFMLGSMTALPCTCKLFKWERDLSDLHSLARIL